ncbi:MAG TPA: hypothetical protein VGJ95_07900 [Pseudonocardiaceae bacterium]|jgi:hypothetical protein
MRHDTATAGTSVAPPTQLSYRDRAVLRAVAAGRCRMASRSLLIDGLHCSDQFVGLRLVQSGLITSADSQPVRLTPSGERVLLAA